MRRTSFLRAATKEVPREIAPEQCYRAIGSVLRELSDVWYWLDNSEATARLVLRDLEEWERAADRRRVAPTLRKDYHDTRTMLAYVRDNLGELADALREFARACGLTGVRALETEIKHAEHSRERVDALLRKLDRAYGERSWTEAQSLLVALDDFEYGLREILSKVANLVTAVGARIERGLLRVRR